MRGPKRPTPLGKGRCRYLAVTRARHTPLYDPHMGIFKDAKANMVAQDARKARQAGRQVFAAMLNTPFTQHTMSGEIADWAIMIEAIEAEGWQLTHWAIGMDTKGRPQAYPVFHGRMM